MAWSTHINIARDSLLEFHPRHLTHSTPKKNIQSHHLNKSHNMTLDIFDFEFPDWEVLHIYQEDSEMDGSTVLLLHRKESVEEPHCVAKIFPISSSRGSNGVLFEATALAKIPQHPNIIKLYSTHADMPRPRQVSLMLEFCAGEDLRAFSAHARSIQRRIPEVFLWHALYQALVALEHLAENHMSHRDIHGGNLLLRPVQGDGYPDIVLADFECCQEQPPGLLNMRSDFLELGAWIRYEFLGTKADETADDTAPYSQELRNVIDVISENCADRPRPQRAEMEHELIPLAKRMAYGDNNTPHRMPQWMAAYFVELKDKAIPWQSVYVPNTA